MAQNRQGHVMMPTQPGARFVVIHPHFAFSFFQGGLHPPAQAADTYEFLLRTRGGRIAQVELHFGFGVEGATKDSPRARAGHAFSNRRDAQASKFSTSLLPGLIPLTCNTA